MGGSNSFASGGNSDHDADIANINGIFIIWSTSDDGLYLGRLQGPRPTFAVSASFCSSSVFQVNGV